MHVACVSKRVVSLAISSCHLNCSDANSVSFVTHISCIDFVQKWVSYFLSTSVINLLEALLIEVGKVLSTRFGLDVGEQLGKKRFRFFHEDKLESVVSMISSNFFSPGLRDVVHLLRIFDTS